VVVSGTATEVGKTWVGAALARELRARGTTVAARKPVQSFAPGDHPTDAEALAVATGEPADDVCPRHRHYELAMAPPMAADALGRPAFTVADLVAEVQWPAGVHVGIVEGVGGPRSPLAADGDTVELATQLGADVVVLVADAALGVINAVRLSVRAFAPISCAVVLNRFDAGNDLHRRNRAWLTGVDGFDVVEIDALAERLAGG
jgi:dethiobiotin synthetase